MLTAHSTSFYPQTINPPCSVIKAVSVPPLSSPPITLPSSIKMHNSVAPLTPHLPSNDHGIPNSLPGVHRENKNRDPDPAADALSGPVNFLSDTYYLPNASAGLIDWETTPPWTLGVTSPSSQEPLEGTGVFDASPSCSVCPTFLCHLPISQPHLRVRTLAWIYPLPPTN